MSFVAFGPGSAELLGGTYFAKATPEAQQRVRQGVDRTLARVSSERQVALILQIGSIFESSDYPALLDLLASSPVEPDPDPTPAKQTVAVKTISVPGASGVLETEEDVDKYLAALRSALVQTLNHGKRISLMETAPLKSFATWARTALIREVTARIGQECCGNASPISAATSTPVAPPPTT